MINSDTKIINVDYQSQIYKIFRESILKKCDNKIKSEKFISETYKIYDIVNPSLSQLSAQGLVKIEVSKINSKNPEKQTYISISLINEDYKSVFLVDHNEEVVYLQNINGVNILFETSITLKGNEWFINLDNNITPLDFNSLLIALSR